MGFLANLLSGGTGLAGANNAHLAELLIPQLSADERRRVAEKVIDMGVRAFRGRSAEFFVAHFNQANRVQQLNAIALALGELDMPPSIRGETWHWLTHPFAVPTDAKDLKVSAFHFLNRHGVAINVGTESIDLLTWISRGEAVTHASSSPEPPNTESESIREYMMGAQYEQGIGVEQDYSEAANWYRRAAEHGHAEAQVALGQLLVIAKGVGKDYEQAANWFRKAAAQGQDLAQVALGHMYAHGVGVPQDYEQAAAWLQEASAQGNAEGAYELGKLYSEGHGVARDEAAAATWYERSASKDYPAAQAALGALYEEGRGVHQDVGIAASWYEKAAARGHKDAQFRLAMLLATGHGIEQDDAQAVAYLRLAADQGQAEAQFELAKRYAHGNGVPEDAELAAVWCRKARRQNHLGALLMSKVLNLD